MRRSQEVIFWKEHYVTILRENGKIKYINGKKFPKQAQEIVNESNE